MSFLFLKFEQHKVPEEPTTLPEDFSAIIWFLYLFSFDAIWGKRSSDWVTIKCHYDMGY